MNILIRLIISTGLIITSLISLNLTAFQGVLLNDHLSAYFSHTYQTTCLVLRNLLD